MKDKSNIKHFLESFDKETLHFLNSIGRSFFTRIQVEKRLILEQEIVDVLKLKMQQIDQLSKENDNFKNLYLIGDLLKDMSDGIKVHINKDLKKYYITIINSFFDVAKQTENEKLIETSLQIKNRIEK